MNKPDPSMVDESKVIVRQSPRMNMGLVPTTMTEAMKLAELMAASTLVPKDLQKKPADCLMVIQQAVRWQMDPFAVAQECSVIQGKLMHSGKLVAAVVNARGNLRQRLSFNYEGEGDARTITVSGLFYGESEPREVSVTLGKVKTSNAQWIKQADQQLAYHGARVWARRHTPELMLGIYSSEEFADADADIANGISVHHPDDYADGIPERLTKPKEEPKYTRALNAAVTHADRARAMQDELRQCTSAVDLLTLGDEMKERQDYKNLPEMLKGYIWKTQAKVLHQLSSEVVHDSDDLEPRSATADDFEPAPEAPEPGPITNRAMAMRDQQ